MKRLLSADAMPLLLFLAGAAATIGLLLLFASAPDARNASSNGDDALSRSAVGYAGLDRLLRLSGIPTEIDRGLANGLSAKPSLTILTPPSTGVTATDWRDYQEQSASLIILPKWLALPMPLRTDWVMKAGALPAGTVAGLVAPLARVSIRQWPGDRKGVALEVAQPLGGLPPALPAALQQLQTFGVPRGGQCGGVRCGGAPLLSVTAADGTKRDQPTHAPLLLQIRGGDKPIYLLSEPDLMNNQGLANEVTAQAALAIIQALRQGNGPVRLDVTLNGLGSERSLMQGLFELPFRGATIAAFLAALLMGFHALARFGAPLRPLPAYARGKKALADNTAALVRIMGREGGMAWRYVQSARDMALARLGTRRGQDEQQALIAILESKSGTAEYEQLATAAQDARTGGDLLKIAVRAYAWRRRISGEYQ